MEAKSRGLMVQTVDCTKLTKERTPQDLPSSDQGVIDSITPCSDGAIECDI